MNEMYNSGAVLLQVVDTMDDMSRQVKDFNNSYRGGKLGTEFDGDQFDVTTPRGEARDDIYITMGHNEFNLVDALQENGIVNNEFRQICKEIDVELATQMSSLDKQSIIELQKTQQESLAAIKNFEQARDILISQFESGQAEIAAEQVQLFADFLRAADESQSAIKKFAEQRDKFFTDYYREKELIAAEEQKAFEQLLKSESDSRAALMRSELKSDKLSTNIVGEAAKDLNIKPTRIDEVEFLRDPFQTESKDIPEIISARVESERKPKQVESVEFLNILPPKPETPEYLDQAETIEPSQKVTSAMPSTSIPAPREDTIEFLEITPSKPETTEYLDQAETTEPSQKGTSAMPSTSIPAPREDTIEFLEITPSKPETTEYLDQAETTEPSQKGTSAMPSTSIPAPREDTIEFLEIAPPKPETTEYLDHAVIPEPSQKVTSETVSTTTEQGKQVGAAIVDSLSRAATLIPDVLPKNLQSPMPVTFVMQPNPPTINPSGEGWFPSTFGNKEGDPLDFSTTGLPEGVPLPETSVLDDFYDVPDEWSKLNIPIDDDTPMVVHTPRQSPRQSTIDERVIPSVPAGGMQSTLPPKDERSEVSEEEAKQTVSSKIPPSPQSTVTNEAGAYAVLAGSSPPRNPSTGDGVGVDVDIPIVVHTPRQSPRQSTIDETVIPSILDGGMPSTPPLSNVRDEGNEDEVNPTVVNKLPPSLQQSITSSEADVYAVLTGGIPPNQPPRKPSDEAGVKVDIPIVVSSPPLSPRQSTIDATIIPQVSVGGIPPIPPLSDGRSEIREEETKPTVSSKIPPSPQSTVTNETGVYAALAGGDSPPQPPRKPSDGDGDGVERPTAITTPRARKQQSVQESNRREPTVPVIPELPGQPLGSESRLDDDLDIVAEPAFSFDRLPQVALPQDVPPVLPTGIGTKPQIPQRPASVTEPINHTQVTSAQQRADTSQVFDPDVAGSNSTSPSHPNPFNTNQPSSGGVASSASSVSSDSDSQSDYLSVIGEEDNITLGVERPEGLPGFPQYFITFDHQRYGVEPTIASSGNSADHAVRVFSTDKLSKGQDREQRVVARVSDMFEMARRAATNPDDPKPPIMRISSGGRDLVNCYYALCEIYQEAGLISEIKLNTKAEEKFDRKLIDEYKKILATKYYKVAGYDPNQPITQEVAKQIATQFMLVNTTGAKTQIEVRAAEVAKRQFFSNYEPHYQIHAESIPGGLFDQLHESGKTNPEEYGCIDQFNDNQVIYKNLISEQTFAKRQGVTIDTYFDRVPKATNQKSASLDEATSSGVSRPVTLARDMHEQRRVVREGQIPSVGKGAEESRRPNIDSPT